MKSKSILFVMALGALYSPHAFSMEQQKDQGYWQRIKDYVAQSRLGKFWYDTENLDPYGTRRRNLVLSNALKGGKLGATAGVSYAVASALMHPDKSPIEVQWNLILIAFGAGLYSSISDLWNYYWQKGALSEDELIEGIKKNVKENLLANCPTKKTRLNMLAQQDYVVEALKKNAASSQQEKLKASIIDKALKQLTQELNTIEESTKDRAIDKKIATLEKDLTGTTQEKINTLDTDLFEATKYLLYQLNLELIAEQAKVEAKKSK